MYTLYFCQTLILSLHKIGKQYQEELDMFFSEVMYSRAFQA